MRHEMKLFEKPFFAIKSGEKTIEIRCGDEKRRSVSIGDIIVFRLIGDEEKYIETRVTALYYFTSFRELYETFEFSRFGCGGMTMDEMLEETRKIYPPEKENKYGALGIGIEIL